MAKKRTRVLGCAFVRGQMARSFNLPTLAPVYSSELVSTIKVLSYIEVESDHLVVVLWDSLSCFLALKRFILTTLLSWKF